MKQIYLLFFLLFSIASTLLANSSLNVINLSRKEIGGGSQTWMIQQAPNGYLYYANKKGLLQFNGSQWNLFNTAKKGELRSILVAPQEKRIYAGGTNELGYFSTNNKQQVVYTSLINSSDSLNNFGSIWNIAENDQSIYFIAGTSIFTYQRTTHKISKKNLPFMINSSLFFNNIFYLGTTKGLYLLSGNTYFQPKGVDALQGMKIRSIITSKNNEILIGTATDGIYKLTPDGLARYSVDAEELLQEEEIFSMAHHQKLLIVGTVKGGVLIYNEDGKLLRHFDEHSGLQNNTVLTCQFDEQNNLWLGLDNGIDYVSLNSPITDLDPALQFIGTGYDAACFENQLYLATNRGLFSLNLPLVMHNNVTTINTISGQVWNLTILNNCLLVATDKGVFQIQNHKITNTGVHAGVWSFSAIKEHPRLMIAKGYNYFYVHELMGTVWKLRNSIPVQLQDHGSLIQDSAEVFWNNINQNTRERLTFNQDYTQLIQQTEDSINAEAAEADTEMTKLPLSQWGIDLVVGFENGCMLDSNRYVIGHENGFALYNKQFISHSKPQYSVRIGKVSAVSPPIQCLYNASILNMPASTPILNYAHNSIVFEYASTTQSFKKNQFEYQLEGYDTSWSDPTFAMSKEYDNLKEGEYIFQVRCYTLNHQTPIATYKFIIQPPWYRTWWAYTSYWITFFLIIFLLFRFDHRRIHRKNKEMERINQSNIHHLEMQLDLKHKGQEIANLTINFLRKNEILTQIKDDIKETLVQLAENKNKEAIRKLKNISTHINTNMTNDAFLKKFEENFDLANNNFIEKLTHNYPSLSVTDRKLCAFIIMGLSTKEISALLELSTRGIETCRYRLRKKFDLDRNASLTDFLNQFRMR